MYPDEFQRWIIVPHGPLHYVPFAALPWPGKKVERLIEDVAMTIAPSASSWLALRQKSRPPVANFLAIADPLLKDKSLPPLENSLAEIANAKKALAGLECKTLSADRATEANVREAIGGANIVHFGAHGEFPEQDAIDFHHILLAPDEDHDGRLTADELRDMDLAAARLIVLSICDGGLYRFGAGDEPLGLIPALLVAGAENILAPLWQVEDTAARRFMSHYYRKLLKLGPTGAWREACRDALRRGAELRDWACFANTGSGAPFVQAARKKARTAAKPAATRPSLSRAGVRKPRKRAR